MSNRPACNLEPKTCICPCGEELGIPIEFDEHPAFNHWSYALYKVECHKCGNKVSGYNGRTGEVTSWMTARQIAQSQAIYEQQQFESDMNEWYGRGEW